MWDQNVSRHTVKSLVFLPQLCLKIHACLHSFLPDCSCRVLSGRLQKQPHPAAGSRPGCFFWFGAFSCFLSIFFTSKRVKRRCRGRAQTLLLGVLLLLLPWVWCGSESSTPAGWWGCTWALGAQAEPRAAKLPPAAWPQHTAARQKTEQERLDWRKTKIKITLKRGDWGGTRC